MSDQQRAITASRDRAAEVLQLLRPHRELLLADAASSDVSGHIDPRVTEVIRAAGGARLATGAEVGASGLVRVAVGLAQVHASAAWNLVVSHTNSLLARSFTELSGAAFPKDPDAQWCGVYASSESHAVPDRAAAGGFRVDGVWRYASNSDIAEWALLNVASEAHGAGFVLVPRSDLSVHERWASLGLRATGSHALAADGLRVSAESFLPAATLFRVDPHGPLALRVPSRLRTALGLAAVGVGSAEALVAELAASIRGDADGARVAALPARGIDRPGVAQALGSADARIAGARAVLLATADELDAAVAHGDPLPAAHLTRARMMLGRVTADVAAAAHEVSMIAGSRACLEGDSVGRLWRDTHVIARHAALSPAVGFDLGARALVHPERADAHAAVGPLAPAAVR